MQNVGTLKPLRSLAILVFVFLVVISVTGKTSMGMSLWTYTRIAPLAALVSPHDAELQFAIGNYYFGGGLPATPARASHAGGPWSSAQEGAYDIKKAQGYFEKALEIDPNIAGAHYQLGRTYFIQSAFYDALREINKELEMHPDFKRSYYMRGLIYGYTKRYAEAERDFKEFLQWKPESWAGNNDLAWIYFQEGKYKDARDTALVGLVIAPNNPWLLNSLGVALLNLGEKQEAMDAFTKTLTILNSMSPKDWGAAYPGNNPKIYDEGLSKMKESVEANMRLLDSVDSK
jgi:tetratricopeptide (TPR) repeat protein